MKNRNHPAPQPADPRRFYLLGFICCLFSATLCGYAGFESWQENVPAMALLGGVEAVLAAFGAGVIGRQYRRTYGRQGQTRRTTRSAK